MTDMVTEHGQCKDSIDYYRDLWVRDSTTLSDLRDNLKTFICENMDALGAFVEPLCSIAGIKLTRKVHHTFDVRVTFTREVPWDNDGEISRWDAGDWFEIREADTTVEDLDWDCDRARTDELEG